MIRRFLNLFLLLLCPIIAIAAKPSVIALTDIGGDSDDEQSMVRFLLYSDQFDLRMIGITSRLNHGEDVRPEIVRRQIEAYGKVYPNLKLHAEGFPHPEALAKTVKVGLGTFREFGEGFDSEASETLVKIVDAADRIVHLVVWGGLRELAQALWKVKQERSADELRAFCRKMQVHAISDQDRHRGWIWTNFPDLRFIANGYPGYFTSPRFCRDADSWACSER